VLDLQHALTEAAAKEHARKQKELHDKQVETLIKIQSALFDKAQSYTRIVIGLGYAGFFAAWAGTRSYMLTVEVVWSALLITFSLFFYIAYEAYQMIFHTTNLKELAKITKGPLEEFERRAEEYEHLVERKNRDLMKVWFVALILTGIPGLVGALILINGFVRFLLTH
jgi:hypothetical protein